VRGRLINPFAADLAQLDPAATAADPDGPGPLTSGYDADFQETVLVPSAGGRGRDARREKPLPRIPCQVEVQAFGELTELATGNSPRSHLVLVFRVREVRPARPGLAAVHRACSRELGRHIQRRLEAPSELRLPCHVPTEVAGRTLRARLVLSSCVLGDLLRPKNLRKGFAQRPSTG